MALVSLGVPKFAQRVTESRTSMSTPNLSHPTLPSLPFALRWMRFLLTISFVVLVSLNLTVGRRIQPEAEGREASYE